MHRLLIIFTLLMLSSVCLGQTLTVYETSTQILNPGTNILFTSTSGAAPGVMHYPSGSTIIFTSPGTYNVVFSIYSTTPTFYTLCLNGSPSIPLYSLPESPTGTVQTNVVITSVPTYMTFQNIYTSPVMIAAGTPGVQVSITI